MNKNDILSKAQQEGMTGKDEGTKYSQTQGFRYGVLGVSIVFAILCVTSFFTNSPMPLIAIAMYLSVLCGDVYSAWKYTGKKYMLVLAVITCLITLALVVRSVMEMAGI